VCPSVDLIASWRRLTRKGNLPYEKMFVDLLLEEMQRRHAASGEPVPELGVGLRLHEFDDRYTAPRVGHPDVMTYYARASALPLVHRIAVPCRVLLADDDPVVCTRWLDEGGPPPGAQVTRLPWGGHLGFLGLPGVRYMDEVVLGWVRSG
jgi:uncharacterized protein